MSSSPSLNLSSLAISPSSANDSLVQGPRLSTDIMLQVFDMMAMNFSLQEVFWLRTVNTLFDEELLRRILSNGRLEVHGFYLAGNPRRERDIRAWSRCPQSLKLRYLRFKFEQHAAQPTELSTKVTNMLELDEVSDINKDVTLENILYGVTALKLLDYLTFLPGATRPILTGTHENQPIEASYHALLACGAIQRGDLQGFTQLVDDGLDLSGCCTQFNLTPLYVLADNGTAAMASVIVRRHGIFQSEGLMTLKIVFRMSVHNHNKPTALVWLEAMKAQPQFDVTDILHETVCVLAEHGDLPMMRFLFEECRAGDEFTCSSSFLTAIESRNLHIVEYFVTLPGFNARHMNAAYGKAPVRLAMEIGTRKKRRDMLGVLLKNGFNPSALVHRDEEDRI